MPVPADRDLVAGQDRARRARRAACCRRARRCPGRRRGGALAAERGDRARVGQEEAGLPPPAEQLVQVVRGRRAAARGDALLEVGVVQQAELAVVDQLVLLALAQRLDGQPELLLDLVHRLVVEVGDPGVHPQHGLRDAQLVLARAQLVVDEACPAAPARPRGRRPARSRPRRACSGARRAPARCDSDVRRAAPATARRGPASACRGSASTVQAVTALTVYSHRSCGVGQRLVAEVVAVGQHCPAPALSPYVPACTLCALPCARRTARSAGLARLARSPRRRRTPAARTARPGPSSTAGRRRSRAAAAARSARRDHPHRAPCW